MTAAELERYEAWAIQSYDEGYDALREGNYSHDVMALITEVRLLCAAIEQQAGMLREITQERDALKLRVAELDRWVTRWHEEAVESNREVERLEARVAELEEAERMRDEARAGRQPVPEATS